MVEVVELLVLMVVVNRLVIVIVETYVSLPNLLAGGLPAGALPGLALAADKRAQHTHATQKSKCTRTPHKKRCMGMHGRYHSSNRDGGAAAHLCHFFHIILLRIIPIHLFLCGVHVMCSFVWRAFVVLFCQLQAPDWAAHLQASPQPRY